MRRITFEEWRQLDPATRDLVIRVDRARYVAETYVGPLVAVGLSAIRRMTSEVVVRDYDEDDRDAEDAADRAAEAARITALSASLGPWVEAAKSEAADSPDAPDFSEPAGSVAVAAPNKRGRPKGAKIPKPPKADIARVRDELIDWPAQFRALVPWSGNQTVLTLLATRLAAMAEWDQSCDALDYEAGLRGVSGVMPGHCRINALDMGFSPGGLLITTHPWREVALLIGVQFAPVLKLATDRFAVRWGDDWFAWRVVPRVAPYYFAWEPEQGTTVEPDCVMLAEGAA